MLRNITRRLAVPSAARQRGSELGVVVTRGNEVW